jgi:hypothetical protein
MFLIILTAADDVVVLRFFSSSISIIRIIITQIGRENKFSAEMFAPVISPL